MRGFYDGTGDGTGDLKGLTAAARLPGVARHRLHLAAALLQLAAARRRLRHLRLLQPCSRSTATSATRCCSSRRRTSAGMRVVADLVMNHTSDQHPWFQESRQDATNPKADWYVWGDDDQRWSEARVIFVDTEPSNWTYDQERGQYFWHRFFHHQPDLNYDNPEVADAMLDVVRFWLDLGLDGFRLDAVPVPLRARRHQRREPPRDPRVPAPASARSSTTSTRGGCSSPRPTSGPRTSSTTSAPTATSATCASTSR